MAQKNPAQAMAVLRRAFGPSLVARDPNDPDGAAFGDPSGSLELAAGRGSRETELENRLANDQMPDPRTGRPDVNTGRDAMLLSFLKGNLANDPNTGTAARARTQHVQDGLDEATTYARPEITALRQGQLADKERIATAVPRVQGEFALKQQQLENEGFAEKQRIANEGTIAAAGAKGGGGRMSAGLMTKVAENSNIVEQLKNLRKMKKDTTTGPVMGRLQSLSQKFPQWVPTSDSFAAFKAETSNITNNLLHTLSGAAVTPAESDRLMNQIPLESDRDEVWEAKASALEKSLMGINKRIALLASGVPADQLDASIESPDAAGDAAPDVAAVPNQGFRIRR